MKAGFGGFFVMIYLIGMTILTGVQAIRRMPRGDMGAVALTATMYVDYALCFCLCRHLLGFAKHVVCWGDDGFNWLFGACGGKTCLAPPQAVALAG